MPEHYVDIDRRSPMLLPVDMRDWVARDRLAQLVIDTIEQCDLRRAVTNDRGTGSRQYPPGMMVSLLIYAYAQGVFSSRRIERLTYENLSFRYVCANTHPDHDTIAKFRRENAALFQDCMRAIIEVGQEFGMVKLGMLAVDGTRLQANANRHRFATREQLEQQQASIEELIKGLLKEAEAADQAHQGQGEPAELLPEFANEQEKVAAIKAVLERAKQREAQQEEQKEHLAQRGRRSNASTEQYEPCCCRRIAVCQAPLKDQVEVALPLLEAVGLAALRAGVPVDARIEKGRTLTHALEEPVGGQALRPQLHRRPRCRALQARPGRN